MVLVSEEKRHNYTHTGVQFYGICRVIAGQGLDAEVPAAKEGYMGDSASEEEKEASMQG